MSTTTIRLEDGLKARLAKVAERGGSSPHAFILDAIARSVEEAELEAEFASLAERRWEAIATTGKTVNWDEARRYVGARAEGQRARRPVARKRSR
jgi:predicted transcriptional regulator